jgi:hypothetical protein
LATALSEAAFALYRKLLLADMERRLPGSTLAPAFAEPTTGELSQLMGLASVMALSEDSQDRTIAYEIVTRTAAIDRGVNPGLIKASEFVLARLGNFPGRTLLRQRHRASLSRDTTANPYLDLECLAREAENSVPDASGQEMALTDFQVDTLAAFSASKSVSVSAPTSAGKSFILSLEVVRKLKAEQNTCIVYLVPTRALIRQVVIGLREELAKANLQHIPIRSIPTPIQREFATDGIVYVLTQERLLSLMSVAETTVWITTLIVDEAQGIGDGGRGVLLHTAVDEVVRRFPDTDVYFACPMARNPEYLLRLFDRANGQPTIEQHSPVSQNLVLVSKGTNRGDLKFELQLKKELISLGERNLNLSFAGGVLERRAKFAERIASKDGCCIVYANGARDAEILAETSANDLTEPEQIDSDIQEFITFLEAFVHKEYGLIHILRKGVAFHYSNMPGSVRAGVEDLCKSNKLKFICCTSTLLQGINLPARDIVVENPKRGMGKPMKRADFVNLAGRAGRLLKEFHGNVWCLRPDLWEEKSYDGEPLQQIESAFESCLKDGGSTVRQLMEDESRLEQRERDTASATLTRIYTEFVLPGRSILGSRYATADNEASLNATVEQLQTISTTLPFEVFAHNHGVLPMRLQALHAELSAHDDPRLLAPIAPFIRGTNNRLFEIFAIVDRCLQRDFTLRYRYYWRLAKEWLHQRQLHEIIADRINYLTRINSTFEVRDTIYSTIEDIEKVIRYRFVKHLRAYNDVLATVLREKGFTEEAEGLVPMHLFLECGAADPVVVSLISIGLSRTSALLIKKRLNLQSNATPEDCVQLLSNLNWRPLGLPEFCRREVVALVGQSRS